MEGHFYKVNPIGHIRVVAVSQPRRLTGKDAVRSGFGSLQELKAYLAPFKKDGSELYRVDFEYKGLRKDQLPDQAAVLDLVYEDYLVF